MPVVHVKCREITPMILSGVLGLLMAFIAYGRRFGSRLRKPADGRRGRLYR